MEGSRGRYLREQRVRSSVSLSGLLTQVDRVPDGVFHSDHDSEGKLRERQKTCAIGNSNKQDRYGARSRMRCGVNEETRAGEVCA